MAFFDELLCKVISRKDQSNRWRHPAEEINISNWQTFTTFLQDLCRNSTGFAEIKFRETWQIDESLQLFTDFCEILGNIGAFLANWKFDRAVLLRKGIQRRMPKIVQIVKIIENPEEMSEHLKDSMCISSQKIRLHPCRAQHALRTESLVKKTLLRVLIQLRTSYFKLICSMTLRFFQTKQMTVDPT